MNLMFQNPEFHQGKNVSVRRGVKWAMEKNATLTDLNGNTYGSVDLDTSVFRFCDLVDSDVQAEHDSDCRTVAGLLGAMKQIYPTFDERELVTVVTFHYGKEADQSA